MRNIEGIATEARANAITLISLMVAIIADF